MPPEGGPIFSRDEITGGLPARRASTLLFAIEARTSLIVARARRAMATFETERTVADREQLFLSALAGGRSLPDRPTIQDLSRYAGQWADLVPDDPQVRAAVLKRIGETYGLPSQAEPIRRVLGAADPAVQAAYARQAGAPLAEAADRPLPARQRFRWWRSRTAQRLESLPPFWLAYVLTLTETVGGGVLALPIALAGFGPLGATVLLVIFGILNTLTVAALVESITRDGRMRYGDAFFGRLIGDYLGRPGVLVAIPALFALDAVGFCVALIGFGITLGAVTGLPAATCAAVLFAAAAIVIWRGSVDATVALAIVIGTVNLAILLLISAIAFAAARPDGFASSGRGLAVDAGLLEVVFGVALVAYFGHTSAGHAAKVVLARDPSGRHLLAANVAAMMTAMVIYIVFVLVLTGAVGAGTLAGYAGTALTPLAERTGPLVGALGTIYITLGLGLSAIYLGLGIFNQFAELIDSILGEHRAARLNRLPLLEFGLRIAPVGLLFAIVAVLLGRGSISFTEPMNLIGTLTLPLLGGVFPMLLVAAARRRGERLPGRYLGLLGQPLAVVAIGGVFLLAIIAFGLWIWDDPWKRAAALAVGAAMAGLAIESWRHGAFRPRTVVEYRVESGPPERGILSIVSAGRIVPATIELFETTGRRVLTGAEIVVNAPNRLQSLVVGLPGGVAEDLEVWIHSVTADGTSATSEVGIEVSQADHRRAIPPAALHHVGLDAGGAPAELKISMRVDTALA
jgi:amino acid permease